MTDLQVLTNEKATFDVFRFQLLVDKTVQFSSDNLYQSVGEIKAVKNDIFKNLINNKYFQFQSGNSKIVSQLVFTKGDVSFFKIGVIRQRRILRKDSTKERIADYQNILIAINNNPGIQKIAIQNNVNAFKNSDVVIDIIRNSIDKELKKHSLSFHVEAIFNKNEFWNIVSKYQEKITQVAFNLISPNLPDLSRNLQVDLKQIYEGTNAHTTTIELNSAEGSHLKIDPESPIINSLVDYSSGGGGNITITVEGLHKKIHLSQSKEEFSVDDRLLKENDWNALDEKLNDIFI
jgi:hypothetical protein